MDQEILVRAAVRGTVKEAAIHTVASRTAGVGMTIATRLSGSNLSIGTTETLAGVIDFAGRQADLTVRRGPIAGVECRVTGGQGYERLPSALLSLRHITTPWISVPIGATTAAAPGTVANGDPAQTISELESLSAGSVTGATQAGSEEIRGVQATEYDLKFDVPSVLRLGNSFLASEGISQPGIAIQSLNMSVWVDAQGLIRRQQAHSVGTENTRGRAVKVTADVNFEPYDFGIAVSVQAPPPDQITSLSSLAALLQPSLPSPRR